MIEARFEGESSRTFQSLRELWEFLDERLRSRSQSAFWSVEGQALDMSGDVWRACCGDLVAFEQYLGLLGVEP